ncbi:MAG TPA: ATP-binding protein [Candidatus Acidoferrum sp.]|nr:ATP-binding protein [Candidatus Acidoferrum sp.]
MPASASLGIRSDLGFTPRAVKLGLLALTCATSVVWLSSRTLLSTNFLPHWYCFVGNTRLLWTTVIADLLIGLSYVAISTTLAWLVRRAGRDLPYSSFFWAFGLFIVSCGVTHFLEIVTVWKPVYWLSAAAKAITAAASVGTSIVLIIAADDIVDFVRTAREAASRRGNERFRALIQATPMPVISSDLDGKVTAWNPAAERAFGWRADEVLGKLAEIVPEDKVQERVALRNKTTAEKVTVGFETARVNREGLRFPVSISTAPVFDENGAVSGLVSVIEDISERKKAELELYEKSAVLTAVTQALTDFLDSGNWSAASQHLLTFAIRQTQSQYGFLGVILEGPVLRILAHDGIVWDVKLDRPLHEEKMQHAQGYFEVAHVHNLLGEVINKGGPVIANSPGTDERSGGLPAGYPPMNAFLGVPIFKGQQAVGLIGVANRAGGYTEQEVRCLETMSQATGVLYDNYRQNLKHAALETQQAKLEAQVRQAQKMEVLGRVAGGVAHDFNNMLMVIGGCSELLERSLAKESTARVYLDQIQRTTEKATAITKQLLAFSRKQVLAIRPMDLHAALTASEFMLPRLLGSDVELTFRHEAAQSWILSDPAQIEQVIMNLVVNSRDAMPEGGRLTVSTRNVQGLPEGGDSAESQTWVVLEVEDTGTGMDEQTRARIFEPFFTTKLDGKGTGLGLATVYGIVKQIGGHIQVESTLGQGTRFEIYFPATQAQAAAQADDSPAASTTDSGIDATILIADDESALRHAIVEILRTSGYKVLEAESSTQALEMARQHPGQLDILLTDIVMPGLRGPELARRVAKIHPEVRIVYMSGYAEEFPEAQLPANSTFLQKPFRFATLLEQLKLVRRRA